MISVLRTVIPVGVTFIAACCYVSVAASDTCLPYSDIKVKVSISESGGGGGGGAGIAQWLERRTRD